MATFLHTFSNFEQISLPERFTYPFHYTPHPLCVQAAEEVQADLQGRTDWHDELQQGKMFGVLIVRTPEGAIGYLAAFSGNLAGSNHHDYFVPPVYDLLNPDGYFKQEEARISELSTVIQSEAKNLGNTHVDATEILRRDAPLDDNDDNTNIERLKEERKQRSIALQQWIFRQFRLRNARGEEKDIEQIFEETARRNPPAGTGECAAPKLLQHAYLQGYHPLAMAEFWWGNSPKGEIRHHGHYYPSCRHKCEPILGFMLQGLEVEPNPLLTSLTDPNLLETVYEDEYLLVVNKPAGMLSVPGKTGQASVLTILQERYPDATGPILVHRLDMATSGLLLAAKDKDTHALLQKQFEGRTVKKRYIALLDGIPQGKEPKGFIRLPMRPDFDNRPLQMVCFEYGKPAVTRYEILRSCHPEPSPLCHPEPSLLCHPERSEGSREHPAGLNTQRTRIAYYPETGRTHQLRVHCAHMGFPILGDPQYGTEASLERSGALGLTGQLLCAHRLEFPHPITDAQLTISTQLECEI